jgi:phosphopantetheinyl transferase
LDQQHSPQEQSVQQVIATEPGGRPYFASHHADFNISHSHQAVALTYTTDTSSQTGLPLRTGCDIQYVNPGKTHAEIARRFFSTQEQTYISAGHTTPEQIRRFYHIWVLKECFLKAHGLSVFDMPQAPCFVSCSTLPLNFYCYALGDALHGQYMLAAALEKDPIHTKLKHEQDASAPLPTICWFSQESLHIKNIMLS